MVQKQNLINLNWKPTQMVVEPKVLIIPFIAKKIQKQKSDLFAN